jgi:hypothetical protein
MTNTDEILNEFKKYIDFWYSKRSVTTTFMHPAKNKEIFHKIKNPLWSIKPDSRQPRKGKNVLQVVVSATIFIANIRFLLQLEK